MALQKQPPSSWWPAWGRSGAAGVASGGALVLAGHPFDTVKVRLQVEGGAGRFRGPWHCLRETVRHEGPLALYKGVTPPLLMTGLINAALWGMQAAFIKALKHDDPRPPTVVETMQAAIFGGFCISFVVQPMEAIKARLQVRYHPGAAPSIGPLACTKEVLRTVGWRRGLYRGWTLTALCRMSNYAYFGPYELLRQRLGMTSGSATTRPLLESLGAAVLCGSVAGVCYWSSCYPLDVVKNRIMTAPDVLPPQYRGGLHCARNILAVSGPRGFLVGLTPCLLRSVPANAAAFSAYELAMHLLP